MANQARNGRVTEASDVPGSRCEELIHQLPLDEAEAHARACEGIEAVGWAPLQAWCMLYFPAALDIEAVYQVGKRVAAGDADWTDAAQLALIALVHAGKFREVASKLKLPNRFGQVVSRMAEAGRRGGDIIPPGEVREIGEWLAKEYKVYLQPLKSETAASEFSLSVKSSVRGGKVYYTPTGQMSVLSLRKNATYAELWHEFMHVLDYKALGAEQFANLPQKVREELAFERFVNTPMWQAINLDERQFLWDYLVDSHGGSPSIPRPTK